MKFSFRDFRCILNAYVLRDKIESDVITIESEREEDEEEEGEDIQLTEDNINIFYVNIWYTELLKSLDRQYPSVFDKITKEIMKDPEDKRVSNNKKKSLKTVLGKCIIIIIIARFDNISYVVHS